MNLWLLGLLPLLGVVIGAALHFWFSRAGEREKRLEALKNEAYADYIGAMSLAVHITSDEEYMASRRQILDAKARILLYGDRKVIEALAEFEKLGTQLLGDHADVLLKVIAAMRGRADAVPDVSIRLVLLGDPRRPKSKL